MQFKTLTLVLTLSLREKRGKKERKLDMVERHTNHVVSRPSSRGEFHLDVHRFGLSLSQIGNRDDEPDETPKRCLRTVCLVHQTFKKPYILTMTTPLVINLCHTDGSFTGNKP